MANNVPVENLDTTKVTLSLLEIYQENSIWVILSLIIVIFFGVIFYKIVDAALKAFPIFQSPDLKLVLSRLDDIEKKIEVNILGVIDTLEKVIEKFHSDLKPDQVEIVLKFAFEATQTGIIRSICVTLEDSLGLTSDERKNSMEHGCKNLITVVDRELYKLPNMQRSMVDSDTKLLSLKDNGYFEMILEKYEQSGLDVARREAKQWLNNIVTEEWYAR